MVVALSQENRALVNASDDLRAWEELSAIGPFDCPGQLWGCPLLIELPIEGSDRTRWMFKVDVLSGAPDPGRWRCLATSTGRYSFPIGRRTGPPAAHQHDR